MTTVVDRIVSPHSLSKDEHMVVYEILFEHSIVTGGPSNLDVQLSPALEFNRLPVITQEMHMAIKAHGFSFDSKYVNRTKKLYYIDINADKKNYRMYKHIHSMLTPHLRNEHISKLVDE